MIGQSNAFNEAALSGRRDYLDTGSGKACIRIYSGTRPSTAGGSLSGNTLLAEITLAKPSGTIASGTMTLIADASSFMAVGSGSAAWARIVNGNGDFAMDCDVTASGGSGEVTLPSLGIVSGGTTTLISGVFS